MKLTPYINYDGNAEEALNFYAGAFNGQIVAMQRYADTPMQVEEKYKQKIVHARLAFGENVIMMSDMCDGKPVSANGNIQLSVEINDPEAMEAIFHKMAIGGTITMPLANQFWGAKFGMLTDKFGIRWMFNCEIKK